MLDEVTSLWAALFGTQRLPDRLGNLRQAEGSVGLQRAFRAQGARSLLVSLWSVSDETTEQLIRGFYTQWLAGESKSRGTRQAQEEVWASPEHPE